VSEVSWMLGSGESPGPNFVQDFGGAVAIPNNDSLMITTNGIEYLIPVAALILVMVVWTWEEFVLGARLIRLLMKRLLESRSGKTISSQDSL
jgi:hypothetical protein